MSKRIYIVLLVLCVQMATSFSAAVQPLTLDSCLEMAKRNNPSLRKAELDVRKAEQVKMQVVTKYFPQIRASAFGFHALRPLVEVGIDDLENANARDVLNFLYDQFGEALGLQNTMTLFNYGYAVGVTAVQPVFVGGKIVAGTKLAQVGVEAAKLQAEIAQREQLEQLEQSYWLVYGLQQKQEIIDDAVVLLDTLYETVQAAVDAGLALPADLMQVTIRRNEVARQQLQLESGLRLARRALGLSIGLTQGDTIEAAEAQLSETQLYDAPSDSLSRPTSPEHQLLTLQIRAAKLERHMALANALPQLAVGANYGYSQWQANMLQEGLHSKTGNGALFVTLQVPLTEWWETGHKIREKNLALEQAQLDAEYLGAQLDLRWQQAYDQLMEAEAMLWLQEKMVAQTEEAYTQMAANYEAGRATIVDLLQAQIAKTKAQTEFTDAQIAYQVRLRRYQDLSE